MASDYESIDQIPIGLRFDVLKRRLEILESEWEVYTDHRGVIQDILKEPLPMFDRERKKWERKIPATMKHDAGAYGRCSYCGRYSDDPAILTYKHHEKCECGKAHGYSGSFKPPTDDSIWNGERDDK